MPARWRARFTCVFQPNSIYFCRPCKCAAQIRKEDQFHETRVSHSYSHRTLCRSSVGWLGSSRCAATIRSVGAAAICPTNGSASSTNCSAGRSANCTAGGSAACCTSASPADNTPDNTKLNERDRNANEPTADRQKDNRSDREITPQVRKAFVKDKSLSTYAHNVKVITQNGMVTLKGPVRSEEEKKAIEAKAAEVAGQDKVTNQLDVKSKD